MNKQISYRIFFYVLGLLILALGLTLNTKAGLGVSPIISVSYSVAQIFELNFGNTTIFFTVCLCWPSWSCTAFSESSTPKPITALYC